MTRWQRVIGPPGTGKTGFIQRQVAAWVEQGVAPERIVLVSHTRAAARVLAERVELPPENIGTLHSLAYRALGRPPVAEVGRLAREWNEECGVASWRLDGERDEEPAADPYGGAGGPWQQYAAWRARGSVRDGLDWAIVRPLAEAWEAFKLERSAVDFSDMLELPVRRRLGPPGAPTHLVVDEAQDLTPAGWALVRWWGSQCERVVAAGDPAQVIYAWAGASPEPLLEDGWDERMLSRSWRLPGDIMEYAEEWLTRHSGRLGEGRWYQPRDGGGSVRRLPLSLADGEAVASLAEEEARRGRTVMVLAQAGYMLRGVLRALRERGVPFWNPYRMTAGAWNPMRWSAGEGRLTTLQRVLSFLRPDPEAWGAEARLWTAEDLVPWVRMLRADQFRERGARDRLLAAPAPSMLDDLAEALTETARAGWEALSLEWLEDAVLAEHREQVAWARRVAERSGRVALRERPRIVVGTIHSVKGGEADVVVAAPDLSAAAAREAETATGRDAMVRLWYVAATRAREELVVLSSSSRAGGMA